MLGMDPWQDGFELAFSKKERNIFPSSVGSRCFSFSCSKESGS
jgi:hypothetical protein